MMGNTKFPRLAGTLVTLALIAFVLSISANHVLNYDEGVALDGAWGLYSGRDLYVDMFQFIAPGTFYALRFAWDLFGPTYEVAAALAILWFLAGCLAVWLTSRLLCQNVKLSYLAPFGFAASCIVMPLINHNMFSASILAWAMYSGSVAIATNRPRMQAVSGLLTGAGTLFLHHKGVAFGLGAELALVVLYGTTRSASWLRHAGWYALGCVPPLLLFLNWPTDVLLDQLILFPARNYIQVNRVSITPLVFAWLLLAMTAYQWGRRPPPIVLYLLCIQTFLLLTAGQRPDVGHLACIAFAWLGVVPAALERGSSGLRTTSPAKIFRFVTIALFLAIESIGLIAWIVKWPPFKDSVHHPGETNAMLSALKRECPSIYAGPFFPNIYFELGLQNPTRYSFLLTSFNTAEQFESVVNDLEANPPTCVVTNDLDAGKYSYSRDNPVDSFISAHYLPAGDWGSFRVFKLK